MLIFLFLPLLCFSQSSITTIQNSNGIHFETIETYQSNHEQRSLNDQNYDHDLSSILSFEAKDTSNQAGISNGDTLTITFEHPMAEPKPLIATKLEIDSVFNFSSSIGSDYKGEWSTPSIAIITLINVRNNSLPILRYTWDWVGTVRYNGTSQTIDSDMAGQPTSRIQTELVQGDWIKIENEPKNGVEILYLNQSKTISGGTLLITSSPVVLMDPKSYKAPKPITHVIPHADVYKRRLVGIVPPPYSSPRFMTDVGRLTIGINYQYTSAHTLTLETWRVGNQTRPPTWTRKRMTATLVGTYGRRRVITPAFNGTVMNIDGVDTVVNVTNATHYQLSLSGNQINSGCFAEDSMNAPKPGISNQDTINLMFGDRTSAPISPIHLSIHIASYNVLQYVPEWYNTAATDLLQNEYEINIHPSAITENAGVTVTQGSVTGTLKTAVSNEWTLVIENAPAITETAGVAVTQGLSTTGTLKTTLSGGATSVIIETTSGVTFVNNVDITIGNTLLVHADIGTVLNNGATKNVVIAAPSGSLFTTTTDLTIGTAPGTTVLAKDITSINHMNMTIPGIDVINTLCRFHLLISMGNVEVITNTTLSILDDAATVRAALEALPIFGNTSIATVTRTTTGFSIQFKTTCPFCRGQLNVKVAPQFFHSMVSFNGTLINYHTQSTSTNHNVVLYNQTCPMVLPSVTIPGILQESSSSIVTTTDVSFSTTLNPNGVILTNDFIHSLIEFSSLPSNDMEGEWLSATHLQIVLKNVEFFNVNIQQTGVGRMKEPKRIGRFKINIKSKQEQLLTNNEHYATRPDVSNELCSVDGTWGEHARVVVTEIRASDLNDPPLAGFSTNDALSLTFNVPTNMPPSKTKEDIDSWLVFGGYLSDSAGNIRLYRCPLQCLYLGTAYTGEWIDAMHLLITIHNPTLKQESGIGPDKKKVQYKEISGVTPYNQIQIGHRGLNSNGGFAVFALEEGPLSTVDDSAPPCKMVSGKIEFCGGVAVGGWGENNDMISVSTVLYFILCLYFFGHLFWLFGGIFKQFFI